MAINTILIVTCLVTGFLLGRMGGGKRFFDGLLFLGDSPEDCHMMLTMSDEELHRSSTVMLRIVNEK